MANIDDFTEILSDDADDRFHAHLDKGTKVLRDPKSREIEEWTSARAKEFEANGWSLYTPLKDDALARFADSARLAGVFKGAISKNIDAAVGMDVPGSRSPLRFFRARRFDRIEPVKFDHKLWLRFLRSKGVLPRDPLNFSPAARQAMEGAQHIKGFDAVCGNLRYRVWAVFVEPFGDWPGQGFLDAAKAFIREKAVPGAGNRPPPRQADVRHFFVWGMARSTDMGVGSVSPDQVEVFAAPYEKSDSRAWRFDAGGEPDAFTALLYPELLESQRSRVGQAFGLPPDEIARQTLIPLANVLRWKKR